MITESTIHELAEHYGEISDASSDRISFNKADLISLVNEAIDIATNKSYKKPQGWIKAIDEAMFFHLRRSVNVDDDYPTAKEKLNLLLLEAKGIDKYHAEQPHTVPVAVVGPDYRLLWASPEPLKQIVETVGLRVGDNLYKHSYSGSGINYEIWTTYDSDPERKYGSYVIVGRSEYDRHMGSKRKIVILENLK